MRKIYIIFTLFISLFLFSSNVKASTYDISILNNSDDYINDSFLSFRDLVIEYANKNNKYYLIYNNSYYSAVFFDNPSTDFISINGTTFKLPRFTPYNGNYYCLSNNRLITCGSLGSIQYTSYKLTDINLSLFLDTNYLIKVPDNYDINITFDSCIYSLKGNEKFYTLYEFHNANKNGCDITSDIHKEEKSILLNFYTIIIEKINLLCDVFVSNYIYLSIFVIFILIFVIELLRRLL